jgi:hypothetical protein
MIDFEADLDRLAADMTVLDVACGAGTRVNGRLEALAAIRALDHVKLQAARRGALVRGYAGVDYWLETVLHIDALRIAQIYIGLVWLPARNGPFHRPTIRPKRSLVNARNGSGVVYGRFGAVRVGQLPATTRPL